ncbi:MAG: hypothetical protein OXF79_14655 [Chloroflexi bacterium]|nr:hypothetical protein [Chloroflexota bacterium]
MLPDPRTVFLALWAPALAGALAIAVTWLVWYSTALPCTLESADELKCRPGLMARYISTTLLHHCVIHSSIAITIVGGSDIMLFLRERYRNNQMMEMMRTFMEEVAEQRRQEAEERRQAEERAAEERRQAEERAAEERRQSAEERQAFLEALNRLTEVIAQNGQGGH